MPPIEAVIFDLDFCLFNEQVYIDAALHDIAHFLASKCDLPEEAIFNKLSRDFTVKNTDIEFISISYALCKCNL